jgi:hypothetical protein
MFYFRNYLTGISAEVKTGGAILALPHVFMELCLIKYRDNSIGFDDSYCTEEFMSE